MSLPKHNTSLEPKNSNSSDHWRVPLSAPYCSGEEIHNVTKVFQSGWWTYGPETHKLERELEDRLGVRHAIAVSNGTAALHLALLALGVSQGDEIVTPSFTFVAASNAIHHAGGYSRFADVASLNTPIVTAESLEQAITPNTRGICLVHYAGYPCAMDSISELAHKYKLWVIEDAAHAPGASWNGIPCGRWGDIACFSFFGNKNITCAEGGAVVTSHDHLAKKLRLLRSHGMDSLTWDRYQGHSSSYDVTFPGFNFRMDDLRAALLRMQLQSLDRINRLRQERVQWYRQLLGQDPRWIIPFEGYTGESSFHLFTVVLAQNISRGSVMHFLKDRGIQSSIHYPPVHQFSFYRNQPLSHAGLTVTEELGRCILTLPLYPDMNREQVEFVCDSFRKAVEQQSTNDAPRDNQ
jgi:dTDP-4-amino-4,6-dideoxygalactose transaminase